MSTATHAAPAPGRLAGGRDTTPGLARLARVELRKMYDTRAGFWLLVSCLGLTLLTAGLTVFTADGNGRTFSSVLENSMQAANALLPIVGILLVTSEWSQRTAQVTFTLVPQRGRVLLAKIVASLVLAMTAFVAALVVSAIFTAIGGEASDSRDVWSVDGGVILQTIVFAAISMLIGVALGAAILLSAGAIVASFVLPIAFSAITELISGLDGVGDWLDQSETLGHLTGDVYSAHQWAQVGTTVLLWLVVPLAIGTYRFVRGEIR